MVQGRASSGAGAPRGTTNAAYATWTSGLATHGQFQLLRAHGGRSRSPRRHSNADVRSSVVVAAEMSAAGG